MKMLHSRSNEFLENVKRYLAFGLTVVLMFTPIAAAFPLEKTSALNPAIPFQPNSAIAIKTKVPNDVGQMPTDQEESVTSVNATELTRRIETSSVDSAFPAQAGFENSNVQDEAQQLAQDQNPIEDQNPTNNPNPALTPVPTEVSQPVVGEASSYETNELLVKFKTEATPDRIAEINKSTGVFLNEIIEGTNIYCLRIEDGTPIEEMVARYQAYPEVEYAEPNCIREIQDATPVEVAETPVVGSSETSCPSGVDPSGTVTDWTGQPVVEATVNVSQNGQPVESATTDQAGAYNAIVPAGEYIVGVSN